MRMGKSVVNNGQGKWNAQNLAANPLAPHFKLLCASLHAAFFLEPKGP